MKKISSGEANQDNHLEQDICIHIFTVSSAMVGVCLTVIGLIRVVVTLGKADTLADDSSGDRRLVVSDLLSSFLLGTPLSWSRPDAPS